MPRNDIGGFFVSLGLNLDKASWETGNRIVDGMGNTFNKLIGTARNAAVVLAGTAIATGSIESAAYKTSVVLGVTTEKLDLWKTAAKIAGVSADGIVGAMTRIADVQNRLKWDDSGIEAFSKKLGKLKISYEEIKDLGADEALEYILAKAQSLEGNGLNRAEIATAVGDIVGTGGRDLYIELQGQEKSVKDFLAGAGKINFTNSQTNKESRDFMQEVRTLKTASENLTKLLGSEIGGELTGYVKSINEWIGEHGTEIANGISTVAQNVGKLVEKIVGAGQAAWPTIKKVGAGAADSVKEGYEGTKKIVAGIASGDTEQVVEGTKQAWNAGPGMVVNGAKEGVKTVQERITDNKEYDVQGILSRTKTEWDKKYGDHPILNIYKKLAFDDLPEDLQSDINDYRKNVDAKWLPGSVSGKNSNKLQDGIIRPDGTVTQVAPDDWVLAARNLGDLSEAFAPVNYKIAGPEEKEPQLTVDGTITQVAPDILSSLTAAIGELAQAMVHPAAQTFNQSSGEYTINQTFNISGGNDMPQVLRQQAYRGTQEGLLEIMQQSSQRLQLMSGTR